MCRRELIMADTLGDDESIVGDECHIVSAVPGGPRYDSSFPQDKVHDYLNLLLLCKVHHKLIDDQELEYTASRLANLKTSHEKWVSEQLDSPGSHTLPPRVRRVSENVPLFLKRVRSGKALLAIVDGACAFASHYDDLHTEVEDALVGGFLQEVQDWGELDLESVSDRIRAERSLHEGLAELEQAGFWVFGGRERQTLEGGIGPPTDWPIAHIQVLRDTNPEIILPDVSPKRGETDVK